MKVRVRKEEPWPPTEKGRAAPGTDRLGLTLFLVSLGIPFLVLVGVAVHMRLQSAEWIPDDVRGLPSILWLSTAAIVGTSVASHWSVRAIRNDDARRTLQALYVGLFFASLFSLFQVLAWNQMYAAFAELAEDLRRYKAVFYLLTGFHFLHVLGGLVLQGWVIVRHRRRKYWSLHHPGLRYAAWYWHFLDALWIVILVTLFLFL